MAKEPTESIRGAGSIHMDGEVHPNVRYNLWIESRGNRPVLVGMIDVQTRLIWRLVGADAIIDLGNDLGMFFFKVIDPALLKIELIGQFTAAKVAAKK